MDLSQAEVLKNCIRQLYREGLSTASGGNISCRELDGNIWISPSQIDKGFLNAEDFALLDAEGNALNQNRASMEAPFHLEIYKNFPGVRAVCHLHPPALVALSVLRPCYTFFKIIEEYDCGFADYAIPGSDELGQNIVDALDGDSGVAIMQNHGVIAVGESMEEAVQKIKLLNEKIGDHFELEIPALGSFDEENDQSVAFYEKRARHFLNPNKINIQENKAGFLAELELRSFYHLIKNDLDLLSRIIPESYLILGEPKFKDDLFSSLIIGENRTAKIRAKSLYALYDRMEVLDFSARVINYANKMGRINPLNDDQIQELKEKFNIEKPTI